MPFCKNQQHSIYYEQHGQGNPVILIHGATVSFKTNYSAFGWVECLNQRGFQVVGIDLRGHGRSAKPLDTESYGTANMASDVLAVLDELGLDQVAVVGYSLGTAVALHLIEHYPARFSKAVLVATGDGLIGYPPYMFSATLPILAEVASRAEYPRDLPAHTATYWNLIIQSGGEPQAVSAMALGDYPPLAEELAAQIAMPVLVVSGGNDPVLGQGPRLAKALPAGEYLEIEGADHFELAAMDSVQSAIADYLA